MLFSEYHSPRIYTSPLYADCVAADFLSINYNGADVLGHRNAETASILALIDLVAACIAFKELAKASIIPRASMHQDCITLSAILGVATIVFLALVVQRLPLQVGALRPPLLCKVDQNWVDRPHGYAQS